MSKQTILLTGATGYIGSHTWCELLDAGFHVVGLDNLCNSNIKVISRIQKITGQHPEFFVGDVRDTSILSKIFQEHDIAAVIHFAALKSLGESIAKPLAYYENNLNGLLSLIKIAGQYDVKKILFSSTAAVYGVPLSVPITEDFPLSTANPYGRSKLMSEQILRDIEQSDGEWRVGYLRYFNPVGAHASGLIGESPSDIPNNLMPYVSQVAAGKLNKLYVYGNDYSTVDGTGVRDYIHVVDLARGHVMAVVHLLNNADSFTVNLGTGCGYSVLQVIRAYEKASERSIPYEVVGRRAGDVATSYADASLAAKLLGWKTQLGLDAMCADSWRWQRMNPSGFTDA